MNGDVLFFALDYASEKAAQHDLTVYFSFNTNGTLMTEEVSEQLAKYRVYVTFSIDGTKAIHDSHRLFPSGRKSYDVAVKNFQIYCNKMKEKYGEFHPRIQCCLPHGSGLYEAYCRLRDLGASILVVNPAWTSSFVKHKLEMPIASWPGYLAEYEQILEEVLTQVRTRSCEICIMGSTAESVNQLQQRRIKPLGCGAGNDGFAIDASGDIYPCALLMGSSAFLIGNVRTGASLDAIDEIQHAVRRHSMKCDNCWASALCGAACLAMAVVQGYEGREDPTPYCDLFRGYIERDILLYARMRPLVDGDVGSQAERTAHNPV